MPLTKKNTGRSTELQSEDNFKFHIKRDICAQQCIAWSVEYTSYLINDKIRNNGKRLKSAIKYLSLFRHVLRFTTYLHDLGLAFGRIFTILAMNEIQEG